MTKTATITALAIALALGYPTAAAAHCNTAWNDPETRQEAGRLSYDYANRYIAGIGYTSEQVLYGITYANWQEWSLPAYYKTENVEYWHPIRVDDPRWECPRWTHEKRHTLPPEAKRTTPTAPTTRATRR